MKRTLRTVTVLSLSLVAGCFLFAPPAAQAQINYQGRLTDALGAPLTDGPYVIQFSLWTAASGGATPVWGPYVLDGGVATGHGPLADLVGSRFNVIIGSQDTTSRSLTTAMTASTSAYLEIKVGNNAPISPRQIILAAPRALLADVIPRVTPNLSGVDVAGNLGVSGNATVSGNVGIGNPTPSAKLDVVGNALVSGNVTASGSVAAVGNVTAGGKSVVVGEENLRIVRGEVFGQANNGACTVSVGSPFVSASRTAVGEYTVNFTSPFTGIPTVTASAFLNGPAGDRDLFVSIAVRTASSVQVRIFADGPDSGEFPRDSAFTFIAIGPR